ncbi:MAG: hypothetical protein GF393_07285 [Armatimonadia bacterium]|nr:hypothetical protein [Armatimonadia bacterium]
MGALFPKLSALLDRIEAGEVAGPDSSDIRDNDAFRWVLFYFKYTGLGAAKARLEAQAARARALLEAGETQQAVEIAQPTLDSLDEIAQLVVSVHQRVDDADVAVPGVGDGCAALDEFSPMDFREPLEAVVAEAGEEG